MFVLVLSMDIKEGEGDNRIMRAKLAVKTKNYDLNIFLKNTTKLV